MDNGKKVALGVTLLLLGAVGVRVGMIYHQRHAPEKPVTKVEPKIDDDDLVYLEQKHQSTPADAKQLIGSTLWMAAGGQMDYYRVTGHRADYAKSQGTLLAVTPLVVKDVFEQVAPKSGAYRIPAGDRQVLLAFTLPQSSSPATLYAMPVGYKEGAFYTFQIDSLVFYEDPHKLFNYWKPEVWKAIDEHRVIDGMNERQVQLALGQISKSGNNDYGNRTVKYANLGHPLSVTFVKNKVTAVQPEQDF
jgi:hypothetical protein